MNLLYPTPIGLSRICNLGSLSLSAASVPILMGKEPGNTMASYHTAVFGEMYPSVQTTAQTIQI